MPSTLRPGHNYLRFWNGAEYVEWAVPAHVHRAKAIEIVKAMDPGWSYIDSTWRADFSQRSLPANSQPTYSQFNTEQTGPRLFHEPRASSAEPSSLKDGADAGDAPHATDQPEHGATSESASSAGMATAASGSTPTKGRA